MKKKKDPLGKSFSLIMEDIKNIDDIPLKPFEKPLSEKNVTGKIQASPRDKHIKGGIIQKTLPVVNAEDTIKFFELDKVGDFLRQRREDKGLSTVDVSKTLCYRRSIIEAIESGNWNGLPHKVYVKGYVRKYASLLGVDEEIAPYMTDKYQEATIDVLQDNKIQEQKQKEKLKPHMSREISIKIPKIPKTAFIYSAVMIVIIGFFIFDMMHKNQVVTSKLENAVHVANNVNNVEEKRNVPQVTDTKKLMITCHERTWVSVIIDGTEKKELMLKPEEVVMLNAKERFDLLVGNAGGVNIFFNGKDTEFTGEKGQVKRVTFS
jgi:cytoskeleton protein RodZ